MRNKIFIYLTVLLSCFLVLASCKPEPKEVNVSSVSLNKTSLSMVEGESQSLNATVLPDDADNKKVTWASDKSSVATVDANGKVTAVAPGTANITVTTEDGGKKATCVVTVKAKDVAVSSVSLDKENAELVVGSELTLVASVLPENATNKKVTWESDDEDVATVDANGKVTAVAPGSANITATTEDGGKKATCVVTVIEATVAVESVTVTDENEQNSGEVTVGETIQLSATVLPEDATDKNVIWSSSDESRATVEDGLVTTLKEGEVTITAKAGEKSGTYTLTIKPIKTTGITLNPTEVNIMEGNTIDLTISFTPEDTKDKDVYWGSSNNSVATVDNNGVVTAVSEGKARISATLRSDNNIVAYSYITVEPDLSLKGISLSSSLVEMTKGKTTQLTVIFDPVNATNKNVVWTSNNEAIATVEGGLVTGVSEGEATITVTSEEGGFTASCKVVVGPKASADIYWKTGTNKVFKNGEELSLPSKNLFFVDEDDNIYYYRYNGYYKNGNKFSPYLGDYSNNSDTKKYGNATYTAIVDKKGDAYLWKFTEGDSEAIAVCTLEDSGYQRISLAEMDIDSSGNVYISARIKDEYSVYHYVYWKITPDKTITETRITDNVYTPDFDIAVTDNGDVYSYFTSSSHEDIMLYKNGKFYCTLYEGKPYISGGRYPIASYGNDIYCVFTDRETNKLHIIKNQDIIYTHTLSDGALYEMTVDSKGNVYYDADDSIYRNVSKLYTFDDSVASCIYVTE